MSTIANHWPASPSEFVDPVSALEIRAELTEMLAVRELPTIRGAFVGAVAAVVMLAPLAPWPWIAVWAVLRLVNSMSNDRMCRRVIALGGKEAIRVGLATRLDLGLTLAGFSWGSLLWLLPPLPWSGGAFLVVLLVFLIRAVMINTCALSKRAMIGFEMASVLAMLLNLCFESHPDAAAIMFGLMILPVGMLYYGLSLHRQSRDTVEARLSNIRLMAHLVASEEREREQRKELSRVNERLEAVLTATRKMALHDALTGCPNRQSFLERVQFELGKADRLPGALVVAIIDFDHFKQINDCYGHPVGDAVLRSGAAAMRKVLRSGDMLARFGGEEFVLLLPQADLHTAQSLTSRVRESLRTLPRDGLPEPLQPTVSIGWSVLHPDKGLDHALARADAALYAAKAAGRDRVCGSMT